MLKQKKADVRNIILILVIIFFLAITMVITVFVNDKFATVIRTTQLNDSAASADILDKMDIVNERTVNMMFGTMIGLLVIGIMVSAFMSKTHPIWMFLYIIFLMVSVFAAAPLANTYTTLIENAIIAGSVAGDMSIINWIMERLAMVMLVIGAFSIVIALSRPESFSGGLASSDI